MGTPAGRRRTGAGESRRAVEAIWRIESARLIAALARVVSDVGVAEELAQDALVVALEQWPAAGVPENPGAWLLVTARRRAIDVLRRTAMQERKHAELARELEGRWEGAGGAPSLPSEQEIDDDMLRLIFICCHPILSEDARVALTLRLLGGLTTAEIARAHLASEATVAQRIARAKRTLAAARVPFELPPGEQLGERLASVLAVIYLIFNEGYAASAGERWARPELCADAMRLGRILAALLPGESEAHGLLALMEIQASRIGARSGPAGEPVLLADQDRGRWNHVLVRRGLDALGRAEALPGPLGPYALQAAIAACHARAPSAAETDWRAISALYDALAETAPSPVVELNRAVAVGMAFGPAEGLALADALLSVPALSGYHLLASVRGDLLGRIGRHGESAAELRRAAAMTRNLRERDLLVGRAECAEARERRGPTPNGVAGDLQPSRTPPP